MKITQAVKMALMAIAQNKMRSFLTMLGIIIGVTSVSMLIALGTSTSRQVTESISALGSNLLSVTVRTSKETFLSLADIDTLRGENGIVAVSPSLTASKSLKAGRATTRGSVEGVNSEYRMIRGLTVQEGRFLVATDLENRRYVAVIGVDIAEELFASRNAVGNVFKIENAYFTVVGVLQEAGSTTFGSDDTRVIIPYTTAQRVLRSTALRQFYVSTGETEDVPSAEERLNSFMLQQLKDTEAYSVFNQTSLLDTVGQVTGLLTLLLGGISGISLLVGGIGIMNIMLVSVTERTREIGIRKAIGARRFDIVFQFMVEAVVLSVTGGLTGVALSYLGLQVISNRSGYALTLTVPVALLALGFSVMVGLVFGIYPAAKASGLRPIDALRYE